MSNNANKARLAAINFGIIDRGEDLDDEAETELQEALDDEKWGQLQDQPNRSRSCSIEACASIHRDPESFDKSPYRTGLQNRYKRRSDSEAIGVWEDDPGTGKTTNAAIAAADEERPHAVLFDKHKKAVEFREKEVTPDGYVHLKGPDRPRYDCCTEADADDENCGEHGSKEEWPRMCPLYQGDQYNNRRQRFETYSALTKRTHAHDIYCPEDECDWKNQLQNLKDEPRIIGVHEHQTIESVREHHDVILDEAPRMLSNEERWDNNDLLRAANLLGSLSVDFATKIADMIHDKLIPGILSGALPSINYDPGEPDNLGETLAKIKVEYNEIVSAGLEMDRELSLDLWDGTPLCFDAILAALAEAGFAPEACRAAIAGPDTLFDCPRCGCDTAKQDGTIRCLNCFWDNDRYSILDPSDRSEQIPIAAYVDTSEDELVFESAPNQSTLPDELTILDATATPERIAGVYGVPVDEIEIHGETEIELNARVMQLKHGQYHLSTIKGAITDGNGDPLPKEEWGSCAKKFQTAINKISDLHGDPLFILKRELIDHFDFPDNAEVLYYYGSRGLDMEGCDAVACLGAPHPNMEGVRREAELLASGHPDLEVGGEEHSTRTDAPNPPIYRKLYYEDDDGRGRAVRTKHYTGLCGALFRESREKELEQCVHRIRPIRREEEQHIYLLTNVPTSLPVDDLVEWDDIIEPLDLPVRDDAITHLLEPLCTPEELPPEAFIERTDEEFLTTVPRLHDVVTASGKDVHENTVRRWTNRMVALGLFTEGDYEQRGGRRYTAEISTLTSALRLVSSNADVKVGLAAELRNRMENADGSLDWLDWARDRFDL